MTEPDADVVAAPELSGVGLTRLLGGKLARLPVYLGVATLTLDAQRDGPVPPRLYTQGVRITTPPLAAGLVNATLQVGAAPGTTVCIHRVTAYARDGAAPQDPALPIVPLAGVDMDLWYSAGYPSPDGDGEELLEEAVGTDGGGPLVLVVAPSLPSGEVHQVLDRVAAGTGVLGATGPLYIKATEVPSAAAGDGRIGVTYQRMAGAADVDELIMMLTYTAAPIGVFPYHA